ncbi:MAG: 50S ribosomal protein L25 [Actinomycetota bacterium]
MEVILEAVERTETGKGANRKLRAVGKIPAVMYGHDSKVLQFSVEAKALASVLHTSAGANVLVRVKIGGKEHLAMPREIQRDCVRGDVLHADFLKVARGERLHVQIPIHLVGDAAGVKAGGIAEFQHHYVNIEVEATKVPEGIEVDVSDLGIGQSLRVSDVQIPEGSKVLDEPTTIVVSVVAPQLAVPTAAEEAASAAAAAEGAAPAAEAKPAEAGGGG